MKTYLQECMEGEFEALAITHLFARHPKFDQYRTDYLTECERLGRSPEARQWLFNDATYCAVRMTFLVAVCALIGLALPTLTLLTSRPESILSMMETLAGTPPDVTTAINAVRVFTTYIAAGAVLCGIPFVFWIPWFKMPSANKHRMHAEIFALTWWSVHGNFYADGAPSLMATAEM